MTAVPKHLSASEVLADKVRVMAEAFHAQAEQNRALVAQVEQAAAVELMRRNDALVGHQDRRRDPPRPYTGTDRRFG